MNDVAREAAPTRGWWQRNRAWLPAVVVLGALAFWLPWQINDRELDRIRPRTAIPAATGAGSWSEYAGARWRITGVRRDQAAVGTAAEYLHPAATRLVIDFEVIPGAGIDAARLDQCKGRLVDASGRSWEANFPAKLSTWMLRQRLNGNCGTRVVGTPATAVAGEPFAFTHAYLIPSDVPTQDLQVDIFFPPFTTAPKMGTYLRFALPAPRD